MLKDAKWVKNLEEFDIAGCKYIDFYGLWVLNIAFLSIIFGWSAI